MSIYGNIDDTRAGDIIVVLGKRYIVTSTFDETLHVVEVLSHPVQHHRSDISLGGGGAISGHASASDREVVRCAPMYRVAKHQGLRIDAASPELYTRVMQGVRREVAVRRYEDTASLASNLMAAAHSTGRRHQPSRSP